MFMFMHPYQDPGSAVLNILEPLKALARSPNKECIAIVQVFQLTTRQRRNM